MKDFADAVLIHFPYKSLGEDYIYFCDFLYNLGIIKI